MLNTLIKYIYVWKIMTSNSFQITIASRAGAILFLSGKILRSVFFLLFLIFLLSKTKVLSGYNLYETIFFFLTFSVVDTGTQLFFREVYRFRPMIISGSFDYVLAKPFNPLFRVLAGGADILDLFMFLPYIIALVFVGSNLGEITIFGIIMYIILLLNSFLIATSFHIIVVALGILTTEIDHTVMIYRDITSTGRIPVDVYKQPLQSFLTFIVPVGIMMTIPAKQMMGLLKPEEVILALVIGVTLFLLSIKFWVYALKRYSSASS